MHRLSTWLLVAHSFSAAYGRGLSVIGGKGKGQVCSDCEQPDFDPDELTWALVTLGIVTSVFLAICTCRCYPKLKEVLCGNRPQKPTRARKLVAPKVAHMQANPHLLQQCVEEQALDKLYTNHQPLLKALPQHPYLMPSCPSVGPNTRFENQIMAQQHHHQQLQHHIQQQQQLPQQHQQYHVCHI